MKAKEQKTGFYLKLIAILIGLVFGFYMVTQQTNKRTNNPKDQQAIKYAKFGNIYRFTDRVVELGLEIKGHEILKNNQPYTGKVSWDEPNLSWSCEVRDGFLDGTLTEYFGNQQLKTEKQFENGYEQGTQKGFHINGAFSYEYQTNKGNVIGCKKEFYANGVQSHEYCFENGERISSKIWTRDGKIMANNVFKEGRYYGLLGSKNCLSVYDQSKESFNN